MSTVIPVRRVPLLNVVPTCYVGIVNVSLSLRSRRHGGVILLRLTIVRHLAGRLRAGVGVRGVRLGMVLVLCVVVLGRVALKVDGGHAADQALDLGIVSLNVCSGGVRLHVDLRGVASVRRGRAWWEERTRSEATMS